MNQGRHIAILGAGVIGASWAALFLAAGHRVAVFDPAAGAEDAVRKYIDSSSFTLEELGLRSRGTQHNLSFHSTAVSAVASAEFVQESVPERLDLKHALYAAIEPVLKKDAVVASSASGLRLSEMQAGWRDPSRLILGHPFNPPHLIPLVEVMGNERTAPGVVDEAERLYRSLGKVTIRVNREVPGHIANRLQAALWREAIHLMSIGAASVEDIDTAIWAGPGLRWAAMGPAMLFHLGAGQGGMAAFCERYAPSFHRWWDDLGNARLDPDTVAKLVAGVSDEAASSSPEVLCERRDELILAMLKATARIRQN
ncbi:MAG: 3-hydroxyacyl-CoA dehydrogenase [Proteobacteria bacterium]|nr:3-hydroxyacyl-CoA dehydrogenase [Pseudomonadota bacterium]